jgi:Ser/Thr protein kinase RdoA (MazF antagonist)
MLVVMQVHESVQVAEALAAWGITPSAVRPLPGGAVNEHWRVESADGQVYVLRRYHPRHAPEGTAYEHDVLAFLAGRNWPVAAPIPASDAGIPGTASDAAMPGRAEGPTVVERAAGRWSLFPFLPGEPPPDSLRSLQRKGALLALLHADLREWDSPGQRPAFSRVTDLDTYVRPDGFPSFEALTEWFEEVDPLRAQTLARIRSRNLIVLEEWGYGDQPDVVIYNECFADNVLFEGDWVTGILDFDLTHEDARVADIARSLTVDCGTDGWRVHSWVTGYAAHAEPRLSRSEADLLPPLMVANEVWNAALPLAIASRTESSWMIESARRSIDERLPQIEGQEQELRRVVRVAAGYPG